jgi:outer membrane protein
MKRLFIMLMVALGVTAAQAQKFALVDMEYILKNIPAYERANEQLNQVSKKWQAEVDALQTEAQTMYKNYQNEAVFLSEEQKTKQEEAIVAKEKEAAELKKKYFGPDGELFKKRESLMTPIQDEIYTAIQEIAMQKGYQVVKDRSSEPSLIYMSNKLDISDQVLNKLGAK